MIVSPFGAGNLFNFAESNPEEAVKKAEADCLDFPKPDIIMPCTVNLCNHQRRSAAIVGQLCHRERGHRGPLWACGQRGREEKEGVAWREDREPERSCHSILILEGTGSHPQGGHGGVWRRRARLRHPRWRRHGQSWRAARAGHGHCGDTTAAGRARRHHYRHAG